MFPMISLHSSILCSTKMYLSIWFDKADVKLQSQSLTGSALSTSTVAIKVRPGTVSGDCVWGMSLLCPCQFQGLVLNIFISAENYQKKHTDSAHQLTQQPLTVSRSNEQWRSTSHLWWVFLQNMKLTYDHIAVNYGYVGLSLIASRTRKKADWAIWW